MALLLELLGLQHYNTQVVVFGSALLGLAAGLIGSFLLLRKRSLLGDALSHSALPGICIAYMLSVAMGGQGKSLPFLLAGAVGSGALGVCGVIAIRSSTRIKEDAALGIVLSVFFGLGIALLGVIQKMASGHAAGLETFIYGKTASMLQSDAALIAAVSAMIAAACILLFKEFTLLSFDRIYAGAQGWPVAALDAIMMALIILVTVVGLQAVGLILMIAFLVIPPASARFWTERLPRMVLISAAIGAGAGLTGAALSAVVPHLPAGAVIVLVGALCFLISLFFGSARGVMRRLREVTMFERRIALQNLLRALYERRELGLGPVPTTSAPAYSLEQVRAMRSWGRQELQRAMRECERRRLLVRHSGQRITLTREGWIRAQRLARNHRLWELYLITHADIAPSHVDRDADQLEHVLGPAMVRRLEELLERQVAAGRTPPSPHRIMTATAQSVGG